MLGRKGGRNCAKLFGNHNAWAKSWAKFPFRMWHTALYIRFIHSQGRLLTSQHLYGERINLHALSEKEIFMIELSRKKNQHIETKLWLSLTDHSLNQLALYGRRRHLGIR